MSSIYLVVVFGDCDPEVWGPFGSEVERDEAAGKHQAETDEDGVYMLDIDGGVPSMNSYSGGYMEELIKQAKGEPFDLSDE
jgi:hypothetical protein